MAGNSDHSTKGGCTGKAIGCVVNTSGTKFTTSPKEGETPLVGAVCGC